MSSETKRRDKHRVKTAAEATGRRVDLPATRPELLARHTEARHRRDASPIGSKAYREATTEIGLIEVEIARVERAMNPPAL